MVLAKILVPVDLTNKTAKAVEVARDLVVTEGDVGSVACHRATGDEF